MKPYDSLIAHFKEYRLIDSIGSLLGWDERTYMPPKGSDHRAEQMALVARLGHDRLASPRLGELVADVATTPEAKQADSDVAANLREIKRAHERAVKIPASLVEELARVTTRAQ